jgi:hypothetical protein
VFIYILSDISLGVELLDSMAGLFHTEYTESNRHGNDFPHKTQMSQQLREKIDKNATA